MPVLDPESPIWRRSLTAFVKNWWRKLRAGDAPNINKEQALKTRLTVLEEISTYQLVNNLEIKERNELGNVNSAWHRQVIDVVLKGSEEFPGLFDPKVIDRLGQLRENEDTLTQNANAHRKVAGCYSDTANFNAQEAWGLVADIVTFLRDVAQKGLNGEPAPAAALAVYERLVAIEKKKEDNQKSLRAHIEKIAAKGQEELIEELFRTREELDDLQRQLAYYRSQRAEANSPEGVTMTPASKGPKAQASQARKNPR